TRRACRSRWDSSRHRSRCPPRWRRSWAGRWRQGRRRALGKRDAFEKLHDLGLRGRVPRRSTVDAPRRMRHPSRGGLPLDRGGLAVLRSVGADAPAQTLTSAAERSGLTRAGARRILLTLQQLGYVEAEGRLFRLTPRVMELGFAYLSSQPVWHLAQPVMEELV